MSTTLVPPTEKLGTVADRPRVTVGGPKQSRERLLSLDVFRGLTVAGMLLVNDPGTWSAIYPPLEHASWNGWTPTDLVFPFFLFIVGITTHLSLSARRARGANESEVRRQILDDGEKRRGYYERFVYSQKFAQVDPWSERVSGLHKHEFKPMATIGIADAAE